MDIEGPGEALRRLLAADRTFADEPRRLRRGLLDLLPPDTDLSTVALLCTGAEAGVPALVAGGDPARALRRLGEAGLRPEIAEWVVAVWSSAVGARPAPASTPAGTPGATLMTGTPDAVRLAAWPDGTLLVVVLGGTGVLAAALEPRSGEPRSGSPGRYPGPGNRPGLPLSWVPVARPASPRSRDVAVTVDEERATVVWSDADGAFAAGVARTGTGVSVDAPRLVVPARDGRQIRHPIAALAVDETSLDVFWSADRQRVHRSTWRSWGADSADLALAECCAPNEHLTRLDASRAGNGTAWLAARTDRGRALVARWDLGSDQIGSWTPLSAAGVLDVALAGDTLAAAMRDGTVLLLPADLSGGALGVERVTPAAESLAAARAGGELWLARRAGTAGLLSRWASDEARSLWAPG